MTERTVEFTDFALYDFTHPVLSNLLQDSALRTILNPGYHTIDVEKSVADIVFIRFEGEIFVYD